ncbi:aminomethyltransferase [Anaeramoeba flamelloides]|uniref:Aminomethyltransferase n=1 Tax=Anaeramoeba flamelloides TaxID=1746091 RepID=A0ABQ8YC51_9EUKA|nr:aminomethyltransferase [Anaeramoeba flamelloides]
MLSNSLQLLQRSALSRFFSAHHGPILKTALNGLHKEHGGKMVPFCGWEMPIKYNDLSIIQSHVHTRLYASLFDVSHMGAYRIYGPDRVKFFNRLVVADVDAIKPWDNKLTCFTNENGGIIDDCMVCNKEDHLYLVVNAGSQPKDHKHLTTQLEKFKFEMGSKYRGVQINFIDQMSLLAIQGPLSQRIMHRLTGMKKLNKMKFMKAGKAKIDNVNFEFGRWGYTGEDGFELAIENPKDAQKIGELLIRQPEIRFAGLGARDSLRLESGLCLYGNDMTEEINPVEANLTWLISKKKRKEGGFIGYNNIKSQILNPKSVKQKRVGFELNGGAPARHNAEVYDMQGNKIGWVSSGGPSPLVKKPIGMCYLPPTFARLGTQIQIKIRKKLSKGKIVRMPFYPDSYYK